MKLSRLTVQDLRQFQAPFTLEDFSDGLNLISGANEAGKSTLVRALQAVFFERHGTTAVKDLLPWNDPGAAPRISVEFAHDGVAYQLDKRFLKKKFCQLRVAETALDGEQAESRLEQLLGFSYPSKGASKAEHRGVPGLLWIDQGGGQEVDEPIANSQEYLRRSLGEDVSALAASDADELIERISTQRDALLTKAGQPRGVLKELQQQRDEAEAELATLAQQVAQFRDQAGQLQQLRQQWQEQQELRPWEGAEAQRQAAEQALQQVKGLQARQQQGEREVQLLTQQQQHLQQQLSQWQQQAESLQRREQALLQQQQQLAEQQQQSETFRQRQQQAEQQRKNARQHWQHCQQAQQYRQHQQQITALQEQLEQLKHQWQQASQCQQQQQTLSQQLPAQLLTDNQLAQLSERERQRATLRIRRDALATRLRYQLEPGVSLSLANEQLDGQGERVLLAETTITVAGVGRLWISPGGEQLGNLAEQLDEAERAYQLACEQLQVSDLEQARQRRSEQQQLQQQLGLLAQQLRLQAPQGLDALAQQLTRLESELQASEQALASLPAPDSSVAAAMDVTALNSAEAAYRDAEQHSQQASDAYQQAREALLTAQAGYQAEQQEVQRLRTEQSDDGQQQRLAEYQQRLAEANKDVTALRQQLTELEGQIAAANPGQLEQDIQRYGDVISSTRQAQQRRQAEIRHLEGQLQGSGGEGLEEQLASVSAQRDRLQRDYQQRLLHAQALDHLRNRLHEQRSALVSELQAPLHTHLQHYLQMLFGSASLSIDEQFSPGQLQRQQQQHAFASLSFGTREQLGVLIRLAYADLLREAGKPTLIILDDALVHSDRQRREAMQRVLYDAARRHQIVLFTCHPEHWQGLGVVARSLSGPGLA